jgi:hypothetical protein
VAPKPAQPPNIQKAEKVMKQADARRKAKQRKKEEGDSTGKLENVRQKLEQRKSAEEKRAVQAALLGGPTLLQQAAKFVPCSTVGALSSFDAQVEEFISSELEYWTADELLQMVENDAWGDYLDRHLNWLAPRVQTPIEEPAVMSINAAMNTE